jgi:hypothetical protein
VDRFDKLSRLDLRIDEPVAPDWQFTGFRTPGLSDNEVIDSWHEYRTHGVLLCAGGYIEQPSEWWADMRDCEALYNTRMIENEPLRPKADG